MPNLLRVLVPVAITAFVLASQAGCSSDGDDEETGGKGSGGSSGSSSGGTGGGSTDCGDPCPEGQFCSQCFNPENPDEPLYACISEGTSC